MGISEAVRASLRLLSRRDRRLLALATLLQMATSLLDLAGVLILGLVAAMSVAIVQSQPMPAAAVSIAEAAGVEGLEPQLLVAFAAALAGLLLLVKTALSSLLMYRVLRFLANRQALVSARLTRELLTRPLDFIQRRSSQESAYALISGAGAATSAILSQVVIAATELSLLIVLGVALLFINPLVSVGAVLFFGLVAMLLHRSMGSWASRVGSMAAEAEMASLSAVQEAMAAYREISVSGRRAMYVDRIQKLRWSAASVAASTQYLGMVPKYIFEVSLVVGGLILAAVLFSTQDAVTAMGTLAVFLVAASRVMPSLMRLQASTLGLRTYSGVAEPTFRLAEELGHPMKDPSPQPLAAVIREAMVANRHTGFHPEIELSAVSVTYPGSNRASLDGVSFKAPAGSSIGLAGPSGAGKSTLADVILGVLRVDSGMALVGGRPPVECVETWPGAVSYVPQDIALANDTIRANVALGLPQEAISDELVWEALRRARLDGLVASRPRGLDELVGERGVRLSGGQRQRLGIARALYTRPLLIVLDEATSALDAETEVRITQVLGELGPDVTTVVIAHRLSTISACDQIYYLDRGRIIHSGTFEQLRDAVPAFERQARLSGIDRQAD
jgi:ATP-binding cassette, subfamily B, bacterial PglK